MELGTCGQDCVSMENDEVIVFSLPGCSACIKVYRILNANGIKYHVIDLREYKRVEGYEGEVFGAPTIFKKKNGIVEFIM